MPSSTESLLTAFSRLPASKNVIAQLGRGAQGVVWEARQASMDRLVAIKILPVDQNDNRTKVERFKREAEAAGRLSHPNVVSTYAFHEYLVLLLGAMELLLCQI